MDQSPEEPPKQDPLETRLNDLNLDNEQQFDQWLSDRIQRPQAGLEDLSAELTKDQLITITIQQVKALAKFLRQGANLQNGRTRQPLPDSKVKELILHATEPLSKPK